MWDRKIDEIDTIEEVDREMQKARDEFPNFKRKLRWRIPLTVVILFLFPYLPGKSGRPTLAEGWGYGNALLFTAIMFTAFWTMAYFHIKDSGAKRERELKLRKHLLKKEDK